MNFARLGYVAERAEVGEHREAILAVTIPERPGSFLEFCRSARRAQRHRVQLPPGDAQRGARLRRRRGRRARGGGGASRAISTAAAIRASTWRQRSREDPRPPHGRRPHARGARRGALRLRVPERPGALLQFLTSLGSRWNISLFHYRNHGAAFGRVLCGFEVRPGSARSCSRCYAPSASITRRRAGIQRSSCS